MDSMENLIGTNASNFDDYMRTVCDEVMNILENNENDYIHLNSIIKLSQYKDYEVVAALRILRGEIRNPYRPKTYQEANLYRPCSRGLTKVEMRRKKKYEILRMIANEG